MNRRQLYCPLCGSPRVRIFWSRCTILSGSAFFTGDAFEDEYIDGDTWFDPTQVQCRVCEFDSDDVDDLTTTPPEPTQKKVS